MYDYSFRSQQENEQNIGSYNAYLICDDLTAPIEQAIDKEKIQELLKACESKSDGKTAKCGFSVKTGGFPKVSGWFYV